VLAVPASYGIPGADDPTQPHGLYGSPAAGNPAVLGGEVAGAVDNSPPAGMPPVATAAGTPPVAGGGIGSPTRRGPWVALGAGVLVLVAVASLLVWYASGGFPGAGPNAGRSSSPRATPASTSPSVSSSNAAGNCLLSQVAPGAKCVSKAECYDQLTFPGGIARAAALSCNAAHTWEVFALGDLPPGLTKVDYQTVKNNKAVRDVCNILTLSTVDLQAADWAIEILPPTPEAFRGGDHTYRCLAGKGPNKLTRPQFAKPAG
jgi:hypothetical protein